MQYDTCADVLAHENDMLDATLSKVGTWRAEAELVSALSTDDIWRVRTKTASEAVGALGSYSVEC
jgi:hypothetical protein